MFGGAIGWAKGKLEKGKAFVKGKVEAGKAWVKGKAAAGKEWIKQKGAGAATWALQKLGLVEVKEDFAMQREDHTVAATGSPEGTLEVTMASHVAVALKPLVVRAITAVKRSPDKDKVAAGVILEDVRDQLDIADQDWASTSSAIKDRLRALRRNADASDKSISEQAAPQMEEGEKKLRAAVKRAVTKIRSIKAPSIQALLDELGGRRIFPPTFINVDGRFRGALYDKPAKWSATRAEFIATEEPRLRAKIRELHEIGARKAAGNRIPKADYDAALGEVARMEARWSGRPTVAKRIVAGGRLDAGAVDAFQAGRLMKFYEHTEYEVDHIVPLAQHWKQTGYKSGDDERGLHAGLGNPGNLQLLTMSQNRSKGGKDDDGMAHFYWEVPHVEDPFSSSVRDVNDIEWITVDK